MVTFRVGLQYLQCRVTTFFESNSIEVDALKFTLQNTCSKHFCGKLGRPESALKKDTTSEVSKS